MTFRRLIVTAIGVALAFVGTAGAADWPQWRGPRRDGVSHEKGWLARWPDGGPKRLWEAKVGRGLATVAVSQGRLYTIGHVKGKDIIWCLDAATGKVTWKHAYPCKFRFAYPGPAATPTVDGDRVFSHSREGDLICLDAAKGTVVWHRNVREDFKVPVQKPDYGNASSPLVLGGLVVVEVGAPDGLIVAFDKASGKTVWRGGEGGRFAYSSPMGHEWRGKQVVVAFHALGLGVFDAADGQELWRYPWKTYDRCSVATPVLLGDRAFISASYGSGAALVKLGQDKPLWATKDMMSHHATCVLWEGHLYGFHFDRRKPATLRCLDAKTGAVKWSAGRLGNGTVTVADGKLIVLGQRGDLVVAPASPEGFVPISRVDKLLTGLCWTVPVLCNKRLYCRNHSGDLVCLDLSGEEDI